MNDVFYDLPRERETDRERDRQTEKERDREKIRHHPLTLASAYR